MPFLTYVRLGQNKLKSLNMLEGTAFLQSLEIQENCLSDLLQISYLNNLNLLISVNFSSNPITNLDNYKHVCLTTIKKLRFLDGQSVEIAQKVSHFIYISHNKMYFNCSYIRIQHLQVILKPKSARILRTF